MMADSSDAIRRFCHVSDEEERLLLSESRPVVLLERKPDAPVPEAVAPRVGTLGFMLPYSPLHHLLLEDLGRPLVMTSGNVSDEPICYEDEDAQARLRRVADYFLLHNRRIHIRADDSVVRVPRDQSAIRNPQSFCAARAATRPRPSASASISRARFWPAARS